MYTAEDGITKIEVIFDNDTVWLQLTNWLSCIENLARDIKLDFPNAKGYSVRNLRYMRKFAEFITDEEIL